MHDVRTELDRMPTLVQDHVVIELKVAVPAKREQRWIAHGRKLAAEGDLRISKIQRISSYALQPGLDSKVVTSIGARLSPGDRKKPESDFVQDIRIERMGPDPHAVDGMRAQVASEAGQ